MKNNIYTKYSIERKEEFKIKTCIYEENGLKWVEKNAENEKSIAHIKKLNSNYKKLSAIFDKDVLVNEGVDKGDKLNFQFVNGQTLEEMMDDCIKNEDYDEVVNLMKSYYQKIVCKLPSAEKKITTEFIDIFGNVEDLELNYVSPSPIDIVFSNVIIDDNWNIIDYEWTFDFPVPANFILYRAVVDYLYKSNKRTILWDKSILEQLGIDEKQQIVFRKMDQHFHEYVNGDCVSLGLMSQRFNHNKYDLLSLQNKYVPGKIQVFFDYGGGFSEDKSKYINGLCNNDGSFTIDIEIPKDVKSIRIDPADRECIIKINKFQYDGCDCSYIDNGIELEKNLKLYQTDDPQWILNNLKEEKKISIDFFVCDITKQIAEYLNLHYLKEENKLPLGMIQAFFDEGKGFCEESSKFIQCKKDEKGFYSTTIEIDNETVALRIDPIDRQCIIKINKISTNETDLEFDNNGISLDYNLFMYNTDDPQWIIKDLKQGDSIYIEFCIEDISSEMSNILCDYISINDKKHRIAQDKIARQMDEIKRLNNITEDLDTQIEKLRSGIEKADNEIAGLKNELLSKENTINEIQNSLSWRITKGLRVAGGIILEKDEEKE